MTLQWIPLKQEHGYEATGKEWRYQISPGTGKRKTWSMCCTAPDKPAAFGTETALRELAQAWEDGRA